MITLQAFLTGVQENIARITHYELGGDGDGGGCDCIGLIIGALKLAGESWPGVHGSNWAARNAMSTFGPIENAHECFVGEIVYKAKEPGEDGYKLPSSYSGSADQRDYYHVGVVTNASPLCITHCTGVDGGIKCDTTLGKWKWCGNLKYVDYEGGGKVEGTYQARVWATNGYPVKLRKLPTTQSSVLTQVPLNTVVDVVYDVDNAWSAVQYNNMEGFMMRKFLEPVENAEIKDGLERAYELFRQGMEILENMMNEVNT